MFALGAHIDPSNRNAERDAEIGKNFTNTCRESYIRTATQIGILKQFLMSLIKC